MDLLLPPIKPLNELRSSQTLSLLGICVILGAAVSYFFQLYQDYMAFKALGPGGTPCTIAGFLRVKVLSFFALRNPYQPPPVPERFRGLPGYLVDLPVRIRPRPVTRGIAPHRQVTQKADKPVFDTLASAIAFMASTNDKLVLGTSCFEKHGTGLFSISPAKRTCRGEICHAHPSDGSMHMTLHPADARLVLEAGWGERHPIARGGWFERFVPAGFVMIYAPQDDEEIAVLLDIVRAAVWFVSGGDGVRTIKEDRRDSGYASEERDLTEPSI